MHDDDPELSTAETAYAEFLEEEDGDFEALCAARPELADELRRIRERHDQFKPHARRLLGGSLFDEAQRSTETASTLDLRAGQTVGDFQLIARLGEGGMGQVWEAEQLSLGRRVALKFILTDALTDRHRAYFDREARAGARLEHPGIVTVYDHGESGGLAWISMQLVEGRKTLRDLVQEGKSGIVPHDHGRRVAGLILEIAQAMQVAHDAGIIHRDLKPGNVLLDRSGAPVITDFGLARILDESALTRTNEVMGTDFYMSPEQFAAKPTAIDHRTDVFSLGVVLYELLTSRRPFEGDNREQVRHQVTTVNPPDPRGIRSLIPRDLAVTCGKTLEKTPAHRYESMSAMVEDLRRFLADEPIAARPPGRVRRARQWVRRNPSRTMGWILAAIAFALIAGGVGWLGPRIKRVYDTAEEARDSDSKGALPAALRAYSDLLSDPLSSWIPGLGDDLRSAASFCGDPGFKKLCEQLGALGETGLRAAHVELQRSLLSPGNEGWRPRLFNFLQHDLRPHSPPLRRELAAETVAFFFLVHPRSYGESENRNWWGQAVQTRLLGIVEGTDGSDPDSRLQQLAMSALSGMISNGVLEATIDRLTAGDLECRMVAAYSLLRLWFQIRKEEGRLPELPRRMIG